MIPDKNLFIVTSSLKPNMGVFPDDQRFSQTVSSLKSIRKVVPDAFIVFSDVSVRNLSDLERETIAGLCNAYIDLSQQPDVRKLSINMQKSQAENVLMFYTLHTLKQNNLLKDVKRIFKFSARSELEDSFDITEYDNLFGKFVFKTKIPTWMAPVQFGATHLLITRMFSMCASLVDTYLGLIAKNIDLSFAGLDTEHAHFLTIPQKNLVEFDKIHCWGWLAGNGQIEHY
jgi:hypothetical protein